MKCGTTARIKRLDERAYCGKCLLRALHVRVGKRFSTLHDRDEAIKEVGRIMRSGARFRVILHAENGLGGVPKASAGPIVEVPMRDLSPCGD